MWFGVSGVEHAACPPTGSLVLSTLCHQSAPVVLTTGVSTDPPVTGTVPNMTALTIDNSWKPGAPRPPALLTNWLQIQGVPMTPSDSITQ